MPVNGNNLKTPLTEEKFELKIWDRKFKYSTTPQHLIFKTHTLCTQNDYEFVLLKLLLPELFMKFSSYS